MAFASNLNMYRIPIRIPIVEQNNGVIRENMPHSISDFRIFKGVSSDIDFVVRNNDRKPLSLVGRKYFILITESSTGRDVFKKPLIKVNDYKGMLRFNLLPQEIVNWTPGYYFYSILEEDYAGYQKLLYVDARYNAQGWFEVLDGALPKKLPAVDLNPADFTPFHRGVYPGGTVRYTSTSLPGNVQIGFRDGIHTFVIYLYKFTGRVWVEGSLDECTPTKDPDWFPISLTPNKFELLFSAESGLFPFNFRTNAFWIRFVYEEETLNEGKITRIVFKA